MTLLESFITVNKKQITKNLESWISAEYKYAGSIWYKNTHTFCVKLALKYNMPLSKIAGVVSAISVGVSWDVNKRQAESIVAAYYHVGNITGITLSTYKRQIQKALDILKLPDKCIPLAITDVLGKRAFKTISFFWNIYRPDLKTHVTIDRHIFNAAGIRTLSGNKGQYQLIIECIKDLAYKYNTNPCKLQATIWLNVTNKNIPI